MRRTTLIFLFLGIVLAFQPDARPQMMRQPGHPSATPQPSAQAPAAHWRWKGVGAQPQPAKAKPFGAAINPNVVPPPPHPAFDPGFAVRLGNTVGLQAFPPVTIPPGVSNINRPGLPPAGQLPPSPNINFPGGVPGLPVTRPHGKVFKGHGQTIIYTVPYYVPYTVYVATPSDPAPQPPLQWEASPPDWGPHIPYTPSASETPPPAQKETSKTRPVTLLAFKDRTIVAVTDYWLEGEMLFYEINPGRASSSPLERLDLVWTQQLNRERNVPFILEAR